MSLRASGLLAVVLFAFASLADPAAPVLKVRQLPRSEFDVEQRGAVSIAYELVIRNPSQQPVTLRKLTMKTMGRSPYVLKDEAVTFDQVIEAGGEATVTFSLWAYRKTTERAPHATVWVRGYAHFESGGRTFVTKFADSFREPD